MPAHESNWSGARDQRAAAGAHAQPLADVLDVLNRLVPAIGLVLLQGCLLRKLGRVRAGLAFASKPLQEEAPRRRVGGASIGECWDEAVGEVVALASSSIVWREGSTPTGNHGA